MKRNLKQKTHYFDAIRPLPQENLVWVTNHSKRTKMEGIQSISTSCLTNPICETRRKVDGSICKRCYADTLGKARKALTKHLMDNMEVLSSHLFTETEAAMVPITSLVARIESFGDVANVIQARNYIRIIKAHPFTKFGIWSKNIGIWAAAFKIEGKPDNCKYVHSSAMVNIPDFILPRFRWFVDRVFTVWDKKQYDNKWKGTPSECAGIHCMSCLKCYMGDDNYEINERLR